MDEERFRRALGFENSMRERSSKELVATRFGTGLLNTDYPKVYDMNYLRGDGDLSTATAPALIADVEDLLGSRGYEHRQVEFDDDATAERLGPDMKEAGWELFRALFMALSRESERGEGLPEAGEVPWPDLRPTVIEQLRREPYATSEEVVMQLTDKRDVTAEVTHLRHFGARVDGRVVSYADLYSDGAVAQIEEVGTLEEFRNRGLASAVVRAAAETALAEGHELVFLVADEDDWPKALYSRLGFDVVGRLSSFRKYPKT